MQKVIIIRLTNSYEFDDLNNRYLDKGWNIINTVKFKIDVTNSYVVFIIQKDTRKEKLESIEKIDT